MSHHRKKLLLLLHVSLPSSCQEYFVPRPAGAAFLTAVRPHVLSGLNTETLVTLLNITARTRPLCQPTRSTHDARLVPPRRSASCMRIRTLRYPTRLLTAQASLHLSCTSGARR